jgi:phosphoribosylglycinamide formyltransferase-1
MTSAGRLRVAVLISGSGTNLQAIIDANADGKLGIDIVGVISDRPEARGLQRADAAGIPTFPIDYNACADRAQYDERLEHTLAQLNPGLIVLAGYMRILPAATVNRYRGRMLNIHPSLLPAYPGLNTYARALEAGETWHGTTVHFVTPELDAGPAILQYKVQISTDETEADLRDRVQRGEYMIYPEAISWFATGRIELHDETVTLDGKPVSEPVIINEQCE